MLGSAWISRSTAIPIRLTFAVSGRGDEVELAVLVRPDGHLPGSTNGAAWPARPAPGARFE